MRRVFLIVLDSFGIGEMPDAADFGDAGANTLASIAGVEGFSLPHLSALGLSQIDGVKCLPRSGKPVGAYGRLSELSAGKDTTVGHFEIAGLVSKTPFPTYPYGFPDEILSAFSAKVGREILCNKPYSGTDVIRDYGEAHLQSGDLIVYTSADSVFQIAAHESLVPPETLYEYCRVARELLVGRHGVARVIARPFVGEAPCFTRTENRRDFSLPPQGPTMLDLLSAAGRDVIAVGKISDIFCGRGVTERIPSHNNDEGMQITRALLSRDFSGLAFINLVDFDMIYGHRNNKEGYAAAMMRFDAFLPELLHGLGEEDCVIITGDHGCDPGDISTDHTREYTPLLIYGKRIRNAGLGTRCGFSTIAQTVLELLSVPADTLAGQSLAKEILL